MDGITRILVVEGSTDSVLVLAKALAETFPVAQPNLAGSIREVHSKMATLDTVELAIVDLVLPDGSGQEVVDVVRGYWSRAQILVYTVLDDDDHLLDALKSGANGYLLKYAAPSRLAKALQAILQGEPPLSPRLAMRMLREFREGNRLPEPGGANAEQGEAEGTRDDFQLTPRELETLSLIAKGLSLPEVAMHLGVQRSVVATYVKRIYRKLAVNSRAEATLRAARLALAKRDRDQSG